MSEPYFASGQTQPALDENALLFPWRFAGRLALVGLPVVAIVVLLPFLVGPPSRDRLFLWSLFVGELALAGVATYLRVTWSLLDRVLYPLPLVIFAGVATVVGWLGLVDVRLYGASPLLLYLLGGGAYIIMAYGPGFFIPRLVYTFIGVPRAMIVMGVAAVAAIGLYYLIPYPG